MRAASSSLLAPNPGNRTRSIPNQSTVAVPLRVKDPRADPAVWILKVSNDFGSSAQQYLQRADS